MEINTGAMLLLLSEATYHRLWLTNTPELMPTPIQLRMYTGQGMNIKGSIEVEVEHNSETANLHVLVLQGDGPSLMGRDWLLWTKFHSVKESSTQEPCTLDAVLKLHKQLFADKPGTIQGTTAKLHVKPDVQPRFFQPRTVTYTPRADTDLTRKPRHHHTCGVRRLGSSNCTSGEVR